MTFDNPPADAAGHAPGTATRTVTICNRKGLHARASAKFVRLAETFSCAITVAKDDEQVDATSIMGLMMLAAGPGAQITISAQGDAAAEALAALVDLVARGFDEDTEGMAPAPD